MRIFLGGRFASVRERFFDNFTRSSSVGLGTATDGSKWTPVTSTLNISGNQAISPNNNANYPLATVDMPTVNNSIELTGTSQGSSVGVWVQSSTDWYMVGQDATQSSYTYYVFAGYASQDVYQYTSTYSYVSGSGTGYTYEYSYAYYPLTGTATGTAPYSYATSYTYNGVYTYTAYGYTAYGYTGSTYYPSYRGPQEYSYYNPGSYTGSSIGPATGYTTVSSTYSYTYNTYTIAFSDVYSSYSYNTYTNGSQAVYSTYTYSTYTSAIGYVTNQYVRVMKSVSGVVTEVTNWLLSTSSVINSFRVKTSGTNLTIQAYSDTGLSSQIGSDLTYNISGATVTPKYGISLKPSAALQGYVVGSSVNITRN